jgi:hypothetical protein
MAPLTGDLPRVYRTVAYVWADQSLNVESSGKSAERRLPIPTRSCKPWSRPFFLTNPEFIIFMRALVLLVTLLFLTPAAATPLEESPRILQDRIITLMKQLKKADVLEEESNCESNSDGIVCNIWSAGKNFVAIYGSSSSRILGIRVVSATDDTSDYYYLLVSTIVAINMSNKDTTPFITLAKTLVESISNNKKYRESKDGLIYSVTPWYIKELKKSLPVVEIEPE